MVIYFSATGTTKDVSKVISSETGAELIEIVPKEKYTSKDLNLTLQELENMNIIEVTRVSSKRCSYKENDIITFLEV